MAPYRGRAPRPSQHVRHGRPPGREQSRAIPTGTAAVSAASCANCWDHDTARHWQAPRLAAQHEPAVTGPSQVHHRSTPGISQVHHAKLESAARKPVARPPRNDAMATWPADAGVLEDLPDRGRCHRDAENRELAVDPAVSPRFVLPGQPQHRRPHLTMRCRAPGTAPARPACPPAADDIPLPAQDRAGSDDQPHRCQALRRDRPREQRQPRPVRPRQTRMSARPLALGRSELMAQHKDLGVLPPLLPPRQPQQRHGTGDNQEDQLQPHKPQIIPPPGRAPRVGQTPTARPLRQAFAQMAQVFGTHKQTWVCRGLDHHGRGCLGHGGGGCSRRRQRYRCPERRTMSGATEVRRERSTRFVIPAGSAVIWHAMPGVSTGKSRGCAGRHAHDAEPGCTAENRLLRLIPARACVVGYRY
jgi:hypothetical protein